MRLVQLNALRIGRKSAALARWYPLSFEILKDDIRGNFSEFWRKTQNCHYCRSCGHCSHNEVFNLAFYQKPNTKGKKPIKQNK